jgi:hypothetical protein
MLGYVGVQTADCQSLLSAPRPAAADARNRVDRV